MRDVEYHKIDKKQLQVLLGYAEQDIHDHTRQATAFTLLKVRATRTGRKSSMPLCKKKNLSFI